MRKLIIILIVFVVFFITNLVLFNFSDDYKFFIKKVKDPEKVVYVEKDDKILVDEITKDKREIKTWTKTIINTWSINDLNKKDTKNISNSWQILLWEQYQKILDYFSDYNLWKLEILTDERLFDVTDEYPDEYYEYYSKNLTLYLFTTKSYNDILDIFKVISSTDSSIFSINESNSFWDKSFFINLKWWTEKDPQVRMVVWTNGLVFWLKFDKDQYNKVKQTLSKK